MGSKTLSRRGEALLAKIVALIDGTDGIFTIAQAAEAMSCDRRTAQRWLRKFAEADALELDHAPASGPRAQNLNRVVRVASAAESTKPPPPYTCIISSNPTTYLREEKKEVQGGGGLTGCASMEHEDQLEEEMDDLFAKIDQRRHGWTPYVIPEGVLLPYPSTDVIPHLLSPPMPKLIGIDREDIILMMRAYRSARSRMQPRRVWGTNLPPNTWERMATALPHMRAAKVNEPHSWAMFRIWSMSRDGGKPQRAVVPKITGVYNRKTFENRSTLEWYHDKAFDIRAPLTYRLESHEELTRLWVLSRDAVIEARPDTHDAAVILARGVLDEVTYERLVRQAEVERARLTDDLLRRVDEGEWIWAF